jgi:hypothetical protein
MLILVTQMMSSDLPYAYWSQIVSPVLKVAFIMLLTPKTGHMSHMVTSHERRQNEMTCTVQTKHFGSGYTQVVFRLLVCLLGLNLSLYLVRI